VTTRAAIKRILVTHLGSEKILVRSTSSRLISEETRASPISQRDCWPIASRNVPNAARAAMLTCNKRMSRRLAVRWRACAFVTLSPS